jgi:CHAT domain-containing protein
MLFYVTGDRREPTTVFVLSAQRLDAVTLTDVDALRPLIARLLRSIEAGDEARVLRQELGARVIEPVLRLLPPGASRLLIVGDGPLDAVPFDALLLPDGRAVLERFEVATTASPAMFLALRTRLQRARPGALALAVAQPDRRSPVNGTALPSLRWATREAQDVAARHRGGIALIGGAAREAALYRRTDTVGTLHIAAHAVIDPVVASRSAIMLAGGSGHDGDLHPWELDRLGISAGLVVLSACRTTSNGGERADGIGGFTAPLLLNGAQAVIATQWNLSDRTAAELMADFHARFAAGSEAGAALRAAKRAFLARGRPPAHWAVFQLTGDPTYSRGR